MTHRDLQYILRYFDKVASVEEATLYLHKAQDFMIKVYKDLRVFQVNEKEDLQGIELFSIYDIKVRFKSFTGESLENVHQILELPHKVREFLPPEHSS